MVKSNLNKESYVAPELEVVSTIVEAGFSLSSVIDDVEVDNYEDEF